MTTPAPVFTVRIPGEVARYLEGTDDLCDARDPDAVALRVAWSAAPVRRHGARGWSVLLSASPRLLEIVAEHARTLLRIADFGEVSRAEIAAAKATLSRIHLALSS